MSTEPTSTTSEEPVQTDGGVAVPESTVTPEPAPQTQTTAAPEAPAPEAEEDILAKVAEHFKDEDPTAVKNVVTAEDVEKLSGRERGVVRALVARMQEREAKDAEAAKVRAAEFAAQKAELERAAADLQRQKAALYALATSPELEAARRAEKPKIDPLSPEGMEALAAFHAQRGVVKALDPIYRDQEQARKDLYAAEVTRKFPVVETKKAEFMAFMGEMNKGINPEDVRAGKTQWRVSLDVGAELFAAKQEAAAAKAAAEQRRAAEVADRTRAAAAINRTAAGVSAQPELRIPDEVYQRGEVAAYLARQTPEHRQALIASERARASRA